MILDIHQKNSVWTNPIIVAITALTKNWPERLLTIDSINEVHQFLFNPEVTKTAVYHPEILSNNYKKIASFLVNYLKTKETEIDSVVFTQLMESAEQLFKFFLLREIQNLMQKNLTTDKLETLIELFNQIAAKAKKGRASSQPSLSTTFTFEDTTKYLADVLVNHTAPPPTLNPKLLRLLSTLARNLDQQPPTESKENENELAKQLNENELAKQLREKYIGNRTNVNQDVDSSPPHPNAIPKQKYAKPGGNTNPSRPHSSRKNRTYNNESQQDRLKALNKSTQSPWVELHNTSRLFLANTIVARPTVSTAPLLESDPTPTPTTKPNDTAIIYSSMGVGAIFLLFLFLLIKRLLGHKTKQHRTQPPEQNHELYLNKFTNLMDDVTIEALQKNWLVLSQNVIALQVNQNSPAVSNLCVQLKNLKMLLEVGKSISSLRNNGISTFKQAHNDLSLLLEAIKKAAIRKSIKKTIENAISSLQSTLSTVLQELKNHRVTSHQHASLALRVDNNDLQPPIYEEPKILYLANRDMNYDIPRPGESRPVKQVVNVPFSTSTPLPALPITTNRVDNAASPPRAVKPSSPTNFFPQPAQPAATCGSSPYPSKILR